LFAFVVGVSVALLAAATPSSRKAGGSDGAKSSNRTIANTPRVEARTFARVIPEGVITENLFGDDGQSVATALRRRADVSSNPGAPRRSEAATTFIRERPALEPLGNTLWLVDDENAIADGVAIDANDVWGAWTLQ